MLLKGKFQSSFKWLNATDIRKTFLCQSTFFVIYLTSTWAGKNAGN